MGQEWDEKEEAVATMTFVYDHHVPDLTRKHTHIQHDFQGHIMAGMHVQRFLAPLIRMKKPIARSPLRTVRSRGSER